MSLKTSICCYQQKYVILNILEGEIVSKNEMDAIFEQINKLNKPISTKEQDHGEGINSSLSDVLNGISEEIQRVLDDNNFTQEDLCEITGMSQSNISKILNGKVAPRIDTLQKIAASTHTRLVISFENIEKED